MSCFERYAARNRLQLTLLAMLGWLVYTLGWMAFAWGQHSFFQNLVSLAIGALAFVGITSAIWVAGQGFALPATVLATFFALTFVLYWIGFAWSRNPLFWNLVALSLSALTWLSVVVALWATVPRHRPC